MVVRCADFPAIELTRLFKKVGKTAARMSRDIRALDVTCECKALSPFVLDHTKGSPAEWGLY